MAKSLSSRFVFSYFHRNQSKSSAHGNPTTSGVSNFITKNPKTIQNPTFSTCLSNSPRAYPSAPDVTKFYGNLDPYVRLLLNRSYLGFRYFSSKINHGMGSKKVGWKMRNPGATVSNAFTRYRDAARLQIEAFLKRNYLVTLGAGGLVVCSLLWTVLFGIANSFIGFSEGMAKYGFLALSSAIVAFTYDMKLLAVDIPMASGPDQRLFLIGDEEGCGLISELRDPVDKALAATKEFEDRDEMDGGRGGCCKGTSRSRKKTSGRS